MHFSDIHENGGTKFTKIAIVVALHVAVATAIIHSIDTVNFKAPKIDDLITVFIPDEAPPPPPPQLDKPKPMEKIADIKIPEPDIKITPPPDAIAGTIIDKALPIETTTGPVGKADPVAETAVNTGVMRTAVLADANGCAKPEYPARAARMGDQGTVSLALLVGVDGKVASAKVQSSSGSRELDKAAINALSLCKFKPATSGGVAEQAWAQIAYVWTLE
jgi:protein TonB